MSQRTCASCDNPVKDSITICGRCERITSQHLGDMEAHRAELEITLTRQMRMISAQDGGRSANTPLAYQELASTLLSSQRAILVSWCRLIHDEIIDEWPKADTVASMAMFVESHLTDLHTHEAAGDLVDEVHDLVRRIMACIDYPDDHTRTVIGPCATIYEDESRCPGQAVLHQPRMYADCAACGKVWDTEQLAELGRKILNREAYGTVSEISAGYGIPDGSIRRWVSEGKLTPMPDGTIPLSQLDKLRAALGRDKVA